jgi:hypothetical protein
MPVDSSKLLLSQCIIQNIYLIFAVNWALLPCSFFCRVLASDRDSPVAPCSCLSTLDPVPCRRLRLGRFHFLLLFPPSPSHDRGPFLCHDHDPAGHALHLRDLVQTAGPAFDFGCSGQTTPAPGAAYFPKTRASASLYLSSLAGGVQ